MARMRSLKPEFWSDRKLIRKTSRDARLLYLSLWNMADEWARVQGDVRWIKGHCLPFDDDLDEARIDLLLGELALAGVVIRYVVEDDPYLYLPKLAKHQRLEPVKTPSRLPAPPEQGSPLVESDSEKIPDKSEKIPDYSEQIVVQHVAGGREHVAGSRLQEGNSPTASAPARAASKGHRIPDDFSITEAMREWAGKTVPGMDLEWHTQLFMNHFQSKPGADAMKLDWNKTWQTWLMRDYKPSRPAQGAARPSATDAKVAQANSAVQSLMNRQQRQIGTAS